MYGMAKLLNLYECANKLGLPAKWLREAAENGVVPCLRLARRDVRFDVKAVRKAVEALAGRADQTPRQRNVV